MILKKRPIIIILWHLNVICYGGFPTNICWRYHCSKVKKCGSIGSRRLEKPYFLLSYTSHISDSCYLIHWGHRSVPHPNPEECVQFWGCNVLIQTCSECLHHYTTANKAHTAWIIFYEGIKLQKLCLFNIYSNIYKMECIKSKNNNTFILRMHANSALSSIQSPLGRRWENRWEVSWLAARTCWESLWLSSRNIFSLGPGFLLEESQAQVLRLVQHLQHVKLCSDNNSDLAAIRKIYSD